MRGKPGQVVARGEDNQGGGQDIPRYLLSRGGGGGGKINCYTGTLEFSTYHTCQL